LVLPCLLPASRVPGVTEASRAWGSSTAAFSCRAVGGASDGAGPPRASVGAAAAAATAAAAAAGPAVAVAPG
jgi:hypothetical protein